MISELEVHPITFRGHSILAVLDQASAKDVMDAAGEAPVAIPEGVVISTRFFNDATGRPALAAAQCGFGPGDDLLFVLVLQDSKGDSQTDETVLQEYLRAIGRGAR